MVQGFATATNPDNNTKSLMFTLSAAQDTHFVSFEIRGKKDGNSLVQVYTRLGEFNGFEQNANAWELIFDQTIQLSKNQNTDIGSVIGDVFTPAGSDRSFHVYAKNGMLFKTGNAATSTAGNGSFLIKNGIFLKDRFKQSKGPGMMSGMIRFYTSSASSQTEDAPTTNNAPNTSTSPSGGGIVSPTVQVTSQPTPKPVAPTSKPMTPTPPTTNVPVKKLFETDANKSANTGGVMFTIKANTDATITSFDIIGKKDGGGQVVIYTIDDYQGNEEDDKDWELLCDKDIALQKNNPVNVGGMDRDVFIKAGSSISFYIWSKKGILYEKGNKQGALFDSDGILEIYEGLGTKNMFNKIDGVAMFSGVIRYVS